MKSRLLVFAVMFSYEVKPVKTGLSPDVGAIGFGELPPVIDVA